MKALIEEILEDASKPGYVPNEADALMLIADALRKIADSIAPKAF